MMMKTPNMRTVKMLVFMLVSLPGDALHHLSDTFCRDVFREYNMTQVAVTGNDLAVVAHQGAVMTAETTGIILVADIALVAALPVDVHFREDIFTVGLLRPANGLFQQRPCAALSSG